jgi:hypothetical protein
MKRLMFGFLVALLLSVPLFAQGMTISFTIGEAKLELLTDALANRVAATPMPTDQERPTVDAAYVEGWVKARCRDSIDEVIRAAEREDARQGGSLDVSTLTRAQRLQVKALIASFQK